MRYRYLDDFRRGISVFAIFSYGIAVLGTSQCPPLYTWDLCRLDGHCHNTAIPVRFASAEMFTENKADETFHVSYTYLYSMAGRRDIDRTYKCVSEWRFFLREKLHLPIYFVLFLTTLWMCYRTIKGILGSCESLCLLFSMLFNFWKKFES